MHSILFSLTRPDGGRAELEGWNSAIQEIEHVAKASKEIEPLGKGVWLLLGSGGLRLLAEGIRHATHQKVVFRVLLIQEASDWSPEPEPPKA